MFAFDRPAVAVLVPLALLLAVALLANQGTAPAAAPQTQAREEQGEADRDHTVAANFPSR